MRIVMQIPTPSSVHQKIKRRLVFNIALVPPAAIEELTQIPFEGGSGYCNRSGILFPCRYQYLLDR